ncbi:hypothetical protein AB0K21_21870 [Streptosporangium sp. NPDC049248]|uniref:hypothetical protein n=1 Tax=Streptosporangium sp. NPDC049248 TaxID=3155651 RepID=UPI00343DFB9C
MSIRIGLHCDTPNCGARVYLTADSATHARTQATHRYSWTHTGNLDHCQTCTTTPTPDTLLVAENFPTNNTTRRTDQKPV